MVIAGRLERHLPTFYKWGRAIKRIVTGTATTNMGIERMSVGKFRVSGRDFKGNLESLPWHLSRISSLNPPVIKPALAPQHLIDPFLSGGRLDNSKSVFASQRERRWNGGMPLFLQETRGAAMVTGPNTDPYHSKQAKVDNALGKLPLDLRVVIKDADQIDILKRFKVGEAKEWKNVDLGYLNTIKLYIKLIDWIRKLLK
jgi:hypothetical protein